MRKKIVTKLLIKEMIKLKLSLISIFFYKNKKLLIKETI